MLTWFPSSDSKSIDAQIWSSCNIRIWDKIGKKKIDKASIIGISMTTASSTPEDAAHAIVGAAIALKYDYKDIQAMKEIYKECGLIQKNSICGDGIREGEEDCDGNDYGDNTPNCFESLGCSSGFFSCSSDCRINYSTCSAGDEEEIFKLELIPDEFGSEISWEVVRDKDEELVISGGGLNDSDLSKAHVFRCLPRLDENECYTFSLLDSYGDGICCEHGYGGYNITIDDSKFEFRNPEYNSTVAHKLCELKAYND